MENIMSSKLFTTRQGTVLLGVIAAVIAAIALLVYLNHYRDSVNKPPVNVLVAKRTILAGTPGDVIRTSGNFYKIESVPEKQVEAKAIVNPASLAGLVAIQDISFGQPLTLSDFGPAGTSVGNALPKNMRAVVIPLGSPQEVGGQIGGGSHVDVWVLTTAGGPNGVARPTAKLLYQDMYVLNAAPGGGNVTLRATPTQAGTLIYASANAQIWLVLRPTIGTTPKPPTISSNALIGHR
jgi:Flp pilus assembly protein CpaB